MSCDMCHDLNHHDSSTEHYLKDLDNYDFIICGRCLHSCKRIFNFLDTCIINNDELISKPDKYI